ncbi:MAG: hypothetical protein EOP20_10805 [Hyphomicrobiales bacterium]|nr:MAG: hypothetical protein EOP20_10805 [Hyphomicrobiales bacterium]
MFNIIYAIVGAVFMVGMALFAFLKGNKAEKFGAGTYLFAWFASLVLQENDGFQGVPVGLMLIDTGVLVAFCAIAWRYRQSWPVWAAGLQLITVMSQFMRLTGQNVLVASLYTVTNLTSYLIIICIIVGTFYAWQERRAASANLGRNS